MTYDGTRLKYVLCFFVLWMFAERIGKDCIHSVQSMKVSCQKGPTRHAYALQMGPFWQDTLVI